MVEQGVSGDDPPGAGGAFGAPGKSAATASPDRRPPRGKQVHGDLFDQLDEGFCVVKVLFDDSGRAVDYRFVEHNAAFARLTGLGQVAGRRIRELAPDAEELWLDTLGRVARTGTTERYELRAQQLRHWYDVLAFRVGAAASHCVGLIFSDISQRKSTEAELRESERRYQALAAERASLLEAERAARIESDRAMRAKDEVLATLSHELRTPLSSIVTWARLLQKQFITDPDMLSKGLTVIGDNAMSLGRLISDLLDTSRMVCGKFELDEEVFDLHELIGSVCSTLRPAAETKGIHFGCDLQGESPRILADAGRLRQVILNLLSNAIKFTPEGGSIRIGSRRADGQFLIDVLDTGEGIERDFLPHLFHRFAQAGGARDRRRGGLGLGLSIARQIVEMHGGTIHAHSEGPGAGSLFTVVLPGQLAERASPLPGAVHEQGVAIDALRGIRVLAVEDQPDMHELLRRILADHAAQVTVVDNADQALALLRNGPGATAFDVLVSDIGLPALDGNQFIRIVRQDLRLDATQLPAVAVSAYARQEDRQRALDAGFQAYMTKPYDVAALIGLLRDFKARKPGD